MNNTTNNQLNQICFHWRQKWWREKKSRLISFIFFFSLVSLFLLWVTVSLVSVCVRACICVCMFVIQSVGLYLFVYFVCAYNRLVLACLSHTFRSPTKRWDVPYIVCFAAFFSTSSSVLYFGLLSNIHIHVFMVDMRRREKKRRIVVKSKSIFSPFQWKSNINEEFRFFFFFEAKNRR